MKAFLQFPGCMLLLALPMALAGGMAKAWAGERVGKCPAEPRDAIGRLNPVTTASRPAALARGRGAEATPPYPQQEVPHARH